VIVGVCREEPSDRQIDSPCLVARELAVSQVCLVDDLSEAGEAAIPEPGPPEGRFGGAVLPPRTQLGPRRIAGNSPGREILWIGEQERRFRIDESLDEPRRGQAVDVGPPARDPLPAPKVPKIPHCLLSSPRLFRWSGAHGNGLPQPLDLGPRRG